MVSKKRAYATLNLSQEATELEIKKAYRKLSLQYHPEKNDNSPESQSKFQEIRAAYELLITGLPNYQVYFGVSEEEIKGLLSEEIANTFVWPDLKNSLDLKEIATAISSEENWENFQKKAKNNRDLIYEGRRKAIQEFISLKLYLDELEIAERCEEIVPKKSQEEIEEFFGSGNLNSFFSFEEVMATKRENNYESKRKNWEKLEKRVEESYDSKLESQEKIFEDLSSLNYLARELSKNIEVIKERCRDLANEGLDTKETLFYFSPEQGQVWKNWLNQLYSFYGLYGSGSDKKIYERNTNEWKKQEKKVQAWIESNFGTFSFLRLAKIKKEHWEKTRGKYLLFFSENEWDEHLKALQEVKSVDEVSLWAAGLSYKEKDADKYYTVLELEEDVTPEKIKERYNELSLLYHPDRQIGKSEAEKGQSEEKFKAINNAYKVLGNEFTRMKYDFCLITDENDAYLNWGKWKKFFVSEELVDEEFGKKIELILQGELKSNNLTEKEITDYGENWKLYTFLHKKNGDGLIEIKDFCLKKGEEGGKILGIRSHKAIKYVRDYLKIIEVTSINKKLIAASIENIKEKLSSEEPKLLPEELNEFRKTSNIYNNYKDYEEIIKNLTIELLAEEKKTTSQKLKNKLDNFIKRTEERVDDVRRVKGKLLEELNQKIQEGNTLLNLTADKVLIAEFLTEFDDFLNSLKNKTSYEAQIEKLITDEDDETEKFETVTIKVNKEVIEQVLKQKEEEISLLISQLKDEIATEEQGSEKIIEETPNSLSNNEPISDEEKKVIIEYLNNVIIEAGKNGRGNYSAVNSNKKTISEKKLKEAQLKVLRDDEMAKYAEKINKADKKKAQEIRQRVINEIFYYINNLKGGSGKPEEAEEIKGGSRRKTLKRVSAAGTNNQEQTTNQSSEVKGEEQTTRDEFLQQQQLEKVLNSIKNANNGEELGNAFQEIKKSALYLNNKQWINDAYRAEASVEFQQILAIILDSKEIEKIKNLTVRISYLDEEMFSQEKSELIKARNAKLVVLDAVQRVNSYWETSGITSKSQTEILGKSWTNFFADKTEKEIIEQEGKLKRKIDEEKMKQQQAAQQVIWQNEAIQTIQIELNKHKISRFVDKVIPSDWQKQIKAKIIEEEINRLRDEFISSIQKAKTEEEQTVKWQNDVIVDIQTYWTNNVTADNKINGKTITEVLEDDWQAKIRNLTDKTDVENKNNDYLRKIAKVKKIDVDYQNTAIDKINEYWNNNSQANNKIDERSKEEILTIIWEKDIRNQTGSADIANKQGYYQNLIKQAKIAEQKNRKKIEQQVVVATNKLKQEERKGWQNEVIKKVEEYWKSKSSNGNLDGEINWKSIQEVLGKEKWQDDIRGKVTKLEIEEQGNVFIKKINDAKEKESQVVFLQIASIRMVNGCWKENEVGGKINEKTKRVLIGDSWEEKIRTKFTAEEIREEQESLMSKINQAKSIEDWQEVSFQERGLNKDLKKLLKGERTEKSKKFFSGGSIKGDIITWFKDLTEILQNDNELLKKICGGFSAKKKEKILAKLEIEQESLPTLMENNYYFKKVINQEGNLVRKYLREIVKVIVDNEEMNKLIKETSEITEFSSLYQHFSSKLKKLDSEKITNFGNLLFKEVVEKSIDKWLVREVPSIDYRELTGDPKNDIPNEIDNQKKLDALKKVQKEIEEKRQKNAIKPLQTLIDTEIISDNREKIKNDLSNLRKLTPHYNNNNLSQVQINAYQDKEKELNVKELELVICLALLESNEGKLWTEINPCDLNDEEKNLLQKITKISDSPRTKKEVYQTCQARWVDSQKKVQGKFQTFHEVMASIDQEKITHALNELKKLQARGTAEEKQFFLEIESQSENAGWQEQAQERITKLKAEINKWKEIESNIWAETELKYLEEGGHWNTQIQTRLNDDLLSENQKKIVLEGNRKKWYEELKEYNSLIEKINKADIWEELKENYKEITRQLNFHSTTERREKIRQKVYESFVSRNPQLLIRQKAEKIRESIKNCNEVEEISFRLKEDIDRLVKDLKDFTTYRFKLEKGKEVEELREELDEKKEKLVFCRKFRNHAGVSNNDIDNNVIVTYLNKGLTPERAVDAYNFNNPRQRIPAEEISNGKADFAGQTYNLLEEEGLKNAQKDKNFVHDFCIQGNVPIEFTDKKILAYHKISANEKHRIVGRQAFNSWQRGWKDPNKIRIDNNNNKQINVGTGWQDYDWEQESFTKASYIFDKDYNKLNDKQLVDEIRKLKEEIWTMKNNDNKNNLEKRQAKLEKLQFIIDQKTKSSKVFSFLIIVFITLTIIGLTALIIKANKKGKQEK